METKDYLNYVVHEIHRTIVATVDDEGKLCILGNDGSVNILEDKNAKSKGKTYKLEKKTS